MRRRPRNLRPDEAKLWRRVADSATPLRPDAPAPLAAKGDAPTEPPAAPGPPGPAAPVPAFRVGQAADGGRGVRHDPAPDPGARLDAAPLRMDRKTHARLKRGKIRPEGKLDLHGMHLAEAHPVLLGYVRRAHAEGKRVVLVITGKGTGARNEDPLARRGVLRHQVPHWLSSPPLSALVQQIVPAHQSHGGGGAYYVYLRRGR